MTGRRVLFDGVPAMRLDVTQLLQGLVGTQVDVQVDLGFHRLSDDLCVEAIKGALNLLRISEGIMVRGVLTVDLDLECTRCLKPVTQTFDVKLDECFRLEQDMHGDEGISAIDEDNHVDLVPIVRELVIVSTPMQVLCERECLGLCPNCGKDLNTGGCDCQLDEVDPRLAALKALIE